MIWQHPAQLLVGAAAEVLHLQPQVLKVLWQSP